MAKCNLLKYVVLAVVGLVAVPAGNMAKASEDRQQEKKFFERQDKFMNEHNRDKEIHTRGNITYGGNNIYGSKGYSWLKPEQKQALFQILESITPQNREETFKKFDDLLEEMVRDNKGVADKEADEAIKEAHGWIANENHAGYLGLTQEQRNKLHKKLDSSEGTLQDKLKNHNSLLEKMHAENLAKATESNHAQN